MPKVYTSSPNAKKRKFLIYFILQFVAIDTPELDKNQHHEC